MDGLRGEKDFVIFVENVYGSQEILRAWKFFSKFSWHFSHKNCMINFKKTLLHDSVHIKKKFWMTQLFFHAPTISIFCSFSPRDEQIFFISLFFRKFSSKLFLYPFSSSSVFPYRPILYFTNKTCTMTQKKLFQRGCCNKFHSKRAIPCRCNAL